MKHFYSQILRDVVDDLRSMRRNGAHANELIDHLLFVTGGNMIGSTEYLKSAFLIDGINLFFMLGDQSGYYTPEVLNRSIDPKIDKAAPRWEHAEPYPDLYRRRDREVFRALAEETGNIFYVAATNHISSRYVGQPGYRPCPWYFGGAVRTEPPNEGLIAWDPGAEAPLLEMRLRVAPAEEGFSVRDEAGAAFFPAYELAGVYDRKTGVSAWTGREGERLRAELNRGFGVDLIQTGPRDGSERRRALPPTHPAFGPRLPVLEFHPDRHVDVIFTREALQSRYAYHKIDWAAAYGAMP
jgi:hypothetical protein